MRSARRKSESQAEIKGTSMKAIRVIAVGMITAGFFMSHMSIHFFREWLDSANANTFIQGLRSIAPELMASTGMNSTGVIVLTFLCAGAGLMVSALLYGPIDDLICAMVRPVMSTSIGMPGAWAGAGANLSTKSLSRMHCVDSSTPEDAQREAR